MGSGPVRDRLATRSIARSPSSGRQMLFERAWPATFHRGDCSYPRVFPRFYGRCCDSRRVQHQASSRRTVRVGDCPVGRFRVGSEQPVPPALPLRPVRRAPVSGKNLASFFLAFARNLFCAKAFGFAVGPKCADFLLQATGASCRWMRAGQPVQRAAFAGGLQPAVRTFAEGPSMEGDGAPSLLDCVHLWT